MILKRIQGTHFQRYRELAILSLPERGLIGVVGENESGKSTIGDAVTFALFGRTFRVGPDRLKDVIHWQSDSASIKVAFAPGDGREYEVLREVDREDTNFAQLTELSSGQVVARGVGKVQRKLDRLIGFGFEEFRHSFHLGQKEFDVLATQDPRARQGILDEMVGVRELASAAEVTVEELERLDSERAAIERELGFTERILGEYADLSADTDPLQEKLGSTEGQVRELETRLAATLGDRATSEAQREHFQEAITGLECLKVRAYAHLIARSASGARSGLAAGAETLAHAEADQREARDRLEALAHFTTRVDELAALTCSRADELNRELKNNLEGVYSEADGDLITPDGKREQLVITEKRIGECEARGARETSRSNIFMWSGIALLTASCAALFLLPALAGLPHYAAVGLPLAVGLLLLVGARQARLVAREMERKRSRLDMNRSILQEEVGRIRRSLEACLSFSRADPASWAERVRLIESPRISELHERIVVRHKGLLTPEASASGAAEALEEKLLRLTARLARVQRERAEMESFGHWLSTTEGTLKSSTAWPKVARDDGVEPWTYETFTAEKPALVAAAGEAARRLYSLEALKRTEGEDPVKLLRDAMARIVSAGKGEAGHEPDAGFYDELARLARGDWEGGADALATRLRGVDRDLNAFLPRLSDLESKMADTAVRRESVTRELASARLAREAIAGELAKLEPDVARGRELSCERAGLEARLGELARAIRVRRALLEMLDELTDGLRRRCGPAIGEFMAWVLPHLTQGRYSAVKLSDELAVRIFATEKGDFVGLEQLSGGTSDQMLLALRLAFSKALIFTRKSPEFVQYLFLDEPFSSFDEQRAAAFLELLKVEDPNFAQVFVVSHLPGLETACDLLIRTTIGTTELIVN